MITNEVQDVISSTQYSHITNYILVGIEAHVCVQQTCLDLLEQDKSVHILADGISSQSSYDRLIAIERMKTSGAYITTAQSLCFMLMQSADHPHFKTISKLTIEHMKFPNQFIS